jgi:hypothetical protein
VCWRRVGACSFYSGEGWPRGCGQVIVVDEATWRRELGADAGVLATSWRSWGALLCSRRWTEACRRRQCLCWVPAEVVNDGVVYRARACSWACLGSSWWCGECSCERRGRGRVRCDGATTCTVVSSGMSWRALARRDVTGHVLCWPLHASPRPRAISNMFRGVSRACLAR